MEQLDTMKDDDLLNATERSVEALVRALPVRLPSTCASVRADAAALLRGLDAMPCERPSRAGMNMTSVILPMYRVLCWHTAAAIGRWADAAGVQIGDRDAQIKSILELRSKIANIELAHQQELHALQRELEAKQALIGQLQAKMDQSQGALLDQVAALEAR